MSSANANTAAADHGIAALALYHGKRKAHSRERLLAAAATLFCERGYVPVSVDDIASAAGLSRMTFYRHFAAKVDIAAELFRCTACKAEPLLLSIGAVDYCDATVVAGWIRAVFESDRANRQLLRVFTQATTERGFSESGREWIRDLISALGQAIPAFAIERDRPDHRRRWLEAWLLIYEIFDQSNHAALDSDLSGDPLMIEILAERFRAFVCP